MSIPFSGTNFWIPRSSHCVPIAGARKSIPAPATLPSTACGFLHGSSQFPKNTSPNRSFFLLELLFRFFSRYLWGAPRRFKGENNWRVGVIESSTLFLCQPLLLLSVILSTSHSSRLRNQNPRDFSVLRFAYAGFQDRIGIVGVQKTKTLEFKGRVKCWKRNFPFNDVTIPCNLRLLSLSP